MWSGSRTRWGQRRDLESDPISQNRTIKILLPTADRGWNEPARSAVFFISDYSPTAFEPVTTVGEGSPTAARGHGEPESTARPFGADQTNFSPVHLYCHPAKGKPQPSGSLTLVPLQLNLSEFLKIFS